MKICHIFSLMFQILQKFFPKFWKKISKSLKKNWREKFWKRKKIKCFKKISHFLIDFPSMLDRFWQSYRCIKTCGNSDCFRNSLRKFEKFQKIRILINFRKNKKNTEFEEKNSKKLQKKSRKIVLRKNGPFFIDVSKPAEIFHEILRKNIKQFQKKLQKKIKKKKQSAIKK